MKIAIQMEPLRAVNFAKSTNGALLREAVRRYGRVFIYQPEMLSFTAAGLSADGCWIDAKENELEERSPESVILNGMDVLLMRQDPPFDMRYITATYLLESLAGQVRVLNNPASVRSYPEKWIPTLFPDYTPPTLITRSPDELRRFAEEHGKVVVKPLYAFGGEGILVLEAGDRNLVPAMELLLARYDLPCVAQAYLPAVTEGDIRILLIDGEVVGAFRRVPVTHDHRANLSAGGQLAEVVLTDRHKAICEVVSPFLKEHGLFFTGLDVIGDSLTEVNVTSPMGITQIEQLTGQNLAVHFWDKVEAMG